MWVVLLCGDDVQFGFGFEHDERVFGWVVDYLAGVGYDCVAREYEWQCELF